MRINCFKPYPEPEIGSLIQVSPRIHLAQQKYIKYLFNIEVDNKYGPYYDVESGAILTYLGKRIRQYNASNIVTCYLFLIDNKIISSVDPGMDNFSRSLNWELIPCE